MILVNSLQTRSWASNPRAQSEISRSEGREREPPSEDEDGEKVQEAEVPWDNPMGKVDGKDRSTFEEFVWGV